MYARRNNPTPSLYPLPMVTAADLAALHRLCDTLLLVTQQLATADSALLPAAACPSLVPDAAVLGKLVLALQP